MKLLVSTPFITTVFLRLRRALEEGSESASAERVNLERSLHPQPSVLGVERGRQDSLEDEEGVRIKASPERVILTGRGVTTDFLRDLKDWLEGRA